MRAHGRAHNAEVTAIEGHDGSRSGALNRTDQADSSCVDQADMVAATLAKLRAVLAELDDADSEPRPRIAGLKSAVVQRFAWVSWLVWCSCSAPWSCRSSADHPR
jgi:hypothetical protein